MVVPSVSDRRR